MLKLLSMFGIRLLLISALILMLSVSASPIVILPPILILPLISASPSTVNFPAWSILTRSVPAVKNFIVSLSSGLSTSINVSWSASVTPPMFFHVTPLYPSNLLSCVLNLI